MLGLDIYHIQTQYMICFVPNASFYCCVSISWLHYPCLLLQLAAAALIADAGKNLGIDLILVLPLIPCLIFFVFQQVL